MPESKLKMPKMTTTAVIIILAVIALYLINSTKTSNNGFEPNVAVGAEKETAKSVQTSHAVKAAEKKTTLADVVKTARSWGPAFQSWYGKQAPDFVLKDISGKEHKLSGYIGKNVMVVFWATWCGPCRMEIPHLKELRSTMGEDKLAILALSSEDMETISSFFEKTKINYTVFNYGESQLNTPFNRVTGIPTTFFIDPQGKIKFAASGSMKIEDMKLILDAQ